MEEKKKIPTVFELELYFVNSEKLFFIMIRSQFKNHLFS